MWLDSVLQNLASYFGKIFNDECVTSRRPHYMLLPLCMPVIWFDRSFDLFKWQKVLFVFIPDTHYPDSIVNMNPNTQQINCVHYVFVFIGFIILKESSSK